MTRATRSPETHLTQTIRFDPILNTSAVLSGLHDTNVKDAPSLASEYLAHASAMAYESADNSTAEFEALARAVVRQIETARALVEASIAGL